MNDERLDRVARDLVDFRQAETLSAFVVIRMALQLGYDAGVQASANTLAPVEMQS
jgi:hypothetical protein